MRDASLREDRVVFLKKQVAATEEELRKKKKKTLAAVSSNNNPSAIVSQRQKRKLTVDKRGKEKQVKEEDEKDPEAKRTYIYGDLEKWSWRRRNLMQKRIVLLQRLARTLPALKSRRRG